MQLPSELLGGAVAERSVRPKRVVISPPVLDNQARMSKRMELVFVKAFVSKAAVE